MPVQRLILILTLFAPIHAQADVHKAGTIEAKTAIENAIRFIRARALARPSREIGTNLPPRLIDMDTRVFWQVSLAFTSPRFGQPEEAILYVDAISGDVIKANRRIEPMISTGNASHLARLQRQLADTPDDLRAYRRWADYFTFRGHQRHVQMFEERIAALSVFEPEGRSHYRLVFNSPRSIDEARAFAALMPRDASVVAMGRLCPEGADLIDRLAIPELPTSAFARQDNASVRFSCGSETRLYSIELELNHRDAGRIRDVAQGLIAIVPIVHTWSYQPTTD